MVHRRVLRAWLAVRAASTALARGLLAVRRSELTDLISHFSEQRAAAVEDCGATMRGGTWKGIPRRMSERCRIDDNRLVAGELSRQLDDVLGPTWAVAALSIPQCDK
jgi:hypothetical protein